MKSRGVFGIVLSFDPAAGGVLRAVDDGRRYTFDASEWRGETGPVSGGWVDFEPDGEKARTLYPVPAGAVPSGPLADRHFLASRPGLPIALLMLIACVFPFLTLGPFSANMFNVVSVASSLGVYAPVNLNMANGLWLFHFLYIVPAAAVLLLVLEWRGLAGRWWRVSIGLTGLLAPIVISLAARARFTAIGPPATLVGRFLRGIRRSVLPDLVPGIGIGWIAIALLSLVLIAVGLFWSRNGRTVSGS